MKLQPLENRVLVKVDPEIEPQEGAIILPNGPLPQLKYGTVVAVGPGNHNPHGPKGARLPMWVNVGDRVWIKTGAPGIFDGSECHLFSENEIFCTVTEE